MFTTGWAAPRRRAGERAQERAVAASPSASVAVPASLHASLMARLDRKVAQIGAAIGREFTHALLVAVVSKPEEELVSALNRIVQADLLFRQGLPPHASYIFKHALVQDAAYGTLLRAQRVELHARLARVLDQQFPDTKENNPEVIARHYAEAGLALEAIDYWQRAGNRSAKRSANQEAVAHFRRAKLLFETLPDRAAFAEQELSAAMISPSAFARNSAPSRVIPGAFGR
jgi:predicted ATPase